ncbi:dihydrofolate reductase family protein [Rhizomicrobium electricum]|uniref:Dihydrofolate reductase family protein n=1 Tax=Rhizomicrobium electricum TaxID=480070 RepID=A0ABN1EHT3_9PROT|nr:dihydrofolate reductase [Rhizomicrobium electricum]
MTGRLVLKMSMSLDGFVCGPAGEVDWIFETFDEGAVAWTVATLAEADVHIMGSRTFADMAAWWPTSTEPFAAPMNEKPKVSFARSGPASTTAALKDATRAREARGESEAESAAQASWRDAEIARGDLAAEIAALKRRYGTILAHGGARFAQSLVACGLIDEYRLLIHPVALGRGMPLFTESRTRLRLLGTQAFSAAVAHIYAAA